MLLLYLSQIPALFPTVNVCSCDDASTGSAVGETDSKADGELSVLLGHPAGKSVVKGRAGIALQSGASGQ